MYEKDGREVLHRRAQSLFLDARPENHATSTAAVSSTAFYDITAIFRRIGGCGATRMYLYQGGDRLIKDLFNRWLRPTAICQPAFSVLSITAAFGHTDEAVRAGAPIPKADLQTTMCRPAEAARPASKVTAPTPSGSASKA